MQDRVMLLPILDVVSPKYYVGYADHGSTSEPTL